MTDHPPRRLVAPITTVDVCRDFFASGSDRVFRANIRRNDSQLQILEGPHDFLPRQGILILGAGETPVWPRPNPPAVTAVGTPGQTRWAYAIAWVDAQGGISAASPATIISHGNASIYAHGPEGREYTTYNRVTWETPPPGTSAVAIYRQIAEGTPNTTGLVSIRPAHTTTWNDYGWGILDCQRWYPVAAPHRALPGYLKTTVVEITGTNPTILQVADPAASTALETTVLHDDTAALQSAIDAVQGTPRRLHLPGGYYLLSATLTATASVDIQGEGARALYGSYQMGPEGASGNLPQDPPYLLGTVLVMQALHTDAIHLDVTGHACHLTGLGISFQQPFRDSGHGLVACPAVLPEGGYDHGILGSRWTDLKVFGHDGDHYGFMVTNWLYGSLYDCHAWGGGGLCLTAANGKGWHYGGLQIAEFYNQLVVHGSAAGIRGISSTTTRLAASQLNNLLFLRLQTTVADYALLGVVPPDPDPNTQSPLWLDSDIFSVTLWAQDIETNRGKVPRLPARRWIIDPTGYWPAGSPFPACPTEPSVVPTMDSHSAIRPGVADVSELAAPTQGLVRWHQTGATTGAKKVVAVLSRYQNATTAAQTLCFPIAFHYPPAIVHAPPGLEATATTHGLVLPIAMPAPVDGVITVEGI